jgi:hypothetical protein
MTDPDRLARRVANRRKIAATLRAEADRLEAAAEATRRKADRMDASADELLAGYAT